MDVEVIVPGHGPLADKGAVRELKAYFEYLYEQARARHAEGMTPLQAARAISLDRWAQLGRGRAARGEHRHHLRRALPRGGAAERRFGPSSRWPSSPPRRLLRRLGRGRGRARRRRVDLPPREGGGGTRAGDGGGESAGAGACADADVFRGREHRRLRGSGRERRS